MIKSTNYSILINKTKANMNNAIQADCLTFGRIAFVAMFLIALSFKISSHCGISTLCIKLADGQGWICSTRVNNKAGYVYLQVSIGPL